MIDQLHDIAELLTWDNPEAQILTDSAGRIFAANVGAVRILGYTREELTGLIFSESICVGKRESCQLASESGALNSEGHPLSTVQRIKVRRKNTVIRPLECESRIVHAGDRRFYQHILRDFTLMKRSEPEDRRKTREMQVLNEASRALSGTLKLDEIYGIIHNFIDQIMTCNGLYVSDYDVQSGLIRCVAGWNDGNRLDVSGFPAIPLQLEGKGTQSRVIRSGTSLLLRDYISYLETSLTSVFISPDGDVLQTIPDDAPRTRSALIVPIKVENRVTGVLQVFSDIIDDFSEGDLLILESMALHVGLAMKNASLFGELREEIEDRREAESALRESEANYRNLFDNTRVGIYSTTPEGRILIANPALLEMLGYESVDELQQRNLEMEGFGIDEPRSVFKKAIEQTGDVKGLIHHWVRKDGSLVHVRETAKAITDESGNISFYEGFVEDISDTVKAEEDKARTEEELFQLRKIEAIGQLAGGVAHDFNNMLMAIMGNAEMLQLTLPPDGEGTTHIENIIDLVKNASGLTRKLLSFARKGTYQNTPLDVNAIVNTSMSILHSTLDRRIMIQHSLCPSPATIMGDESQLQNVVLNVSLNTRDAMPDGGLLTFRTEIMEIHDMKDRNHAVIIPPGTYVALSITDTGIGMSEEVKQHLFEPFFTTKGLGRGTGLGLASVYGIVKDHKGFIDVESEEGKGTIITLFFPLSGELVLQQKKSPPAEHIQQNTGRILFVDDEEMIRTMGALLLQKLGYEVTTCPDGQAAIEFFSEHFPGIDLVILDMIMPRLNGKEAFKSLRAINPAVKVIISSGYSADGDIEEILTNSGTGFIQKPFRLQQLATILKQILEKQGECP